LTDNFRLVSIESLKKIHQNDSYSNIVINNDIKKIDEKFHNIYRKTVLGVIENIYFLDYITNKFSSTKTKKLQTEILIAFRLAVYQIFFLENSKEFVVVNESVEYIKKKIDMRASKFVNAVLRNILRNKDHILLDIEAMKNSSKESDKLEYLSIKYSYPILLIKKFINQFGRDKIEEVLQKNNEEAKLNIRVNTTKISKEELKKRLEQKNIVCTDCKIAEKGMTLDNISNLENLEEFKNGLFSVQSESSMLVGQVLNPKENSMILDICAAPGGKTMDIAERLNNTGSVISRDLYEHKIKLVKNDVKRLGLKNVKVQLADASIFDEKVESKFDYCIVDVPCSGLGIIRRKPEIKYKKQEDNKDGISNNNLFNLQYKILENASRYLKINGELIYSTCTTDKKENIELVKYFIEKNPNYELIDISTETKSIFETSKKGYIEIYPHIHDLDGYFIAKIMKTMI
jgi:16S rRNA (cytosine967-C5)-methyltransferase